MSSVQDAWARWEIDRLKQEIGSSGYSSSITSRLPIWQHQSWTAPATYQLNYLPYGINALFVNGLALVYGIDYTVDVTTGILTISDTVNSGDAVYCSYVTTGVLAGSSSLTVTSETGWVTSASYAGTNPRDVILMILTGADAATTATPGGLGATWTRLENQPWTGNGASLWLGYSIATSGTITISGVSHPYGFNALQVSGSSGDASAVQSSASSTAVGIMQTQPVTPTSSGCLVVGVTVVGNSVAGGTQTWTDTPSGWTSMVIDASGTGAGGWLTNAPSGTACKRVGSVDSTPYTHARFGVVVQR